MGDARKSSGDLAGVGQVLQLLLASNAEMLSVLKDISSSLQAQAASTTSANTGTTSSSGNNSVIPPSAVVLPPPGLERMSPGAKSADFAVSCVGPKIETLSLQG